MRNNVVAALLVMAILVGAGAGYLVGYSNQRTTTSTSVSVSTLSTLTIATTLTQIATLTHLVTNSTNSPCDTTFASGLQLQAGNWSGNGGYRQMRVFLMSANSTARICVTYTVMPSGNGTGEISLPKSTQITFTGQVSTISVTYMEGGGYSVNSIVPAVGITDHATPSTFNYTSGSKVTNITVVYSISTSPTVTGIYALGYFMNCPPWIPLSVGYNINDTQRLIVTEYPIFLFPSSCIGQLPISGGAITGVSGLNLAWVSVS